MRIFLYVFFTVLVLTGCSLRPLDRGEGHMLALRPVTDAAAIERAPDRPRPAAQNRLLVVGFPTAVAAIDSSRVALFRPDGTADYFLRTRWQDFLPVIIQARLTDTLAATNLFEKVRNDETGLGGGFLLKTHVRNFEAVYPAYLHQPPEVRIDIDFTLVNVQSGRQVRSFTLTSAQQARANTVAEIHQAFLAGFDDIQRQLVAGL